VNPRTASATILTAILLAAGCRRGGQEPAPAETPPPTVDIVPPGLRTLGVMSVTQDVTRPSAVGKHHGDIAQPRFTADSRALFGRAVPVGKDPVAVPKVGEYVVWDVATGAERHRFPVDEAVLSYEPGTADGHCWVAMSRRYQFLEFDPKPQLSDVPGAPGPTKAVTRPSFSHDFGRMAYSDYREPEADRQAHVLNRDGDNWSRVMSVAGQNAKLSPDGSRLVTLTRALPAPDIVVRVWSVPDGRPVWSVPSDRFWLHGFTDDGKYVVQGGMSEFRLYDAATGKDIRLKLKTEDRVKAAYAGGRVLTAIHIPNRQGVLLETWDAATGKSLGQRTTPPGSTLSRTQDEPFTTPRVAVVLGAEERKIPGEKGHSITVWTVEVYDPRQTEPIATLKVPGLSYVLVAPDGSVAAVLTYGRPQFYRLPAP
jgi:hypothetical protein